MSLSFNKSLDRSGIPLSLVSKSSGFPETLRNPEPLGSAELASIIVSSIIGSLFFICLIATCTCGRVIIGGDEQTHWRMTSSQELPQPLSRPQGM